MFDQKKAAARAVLQCLTLLVPLLLSCSSGDSRTLHLKQNQAVPSLESESERLRRLQLVRVVNTSSNPPAEQEIDAGVLLDEAYFACGGDTCYSNPDACGQRLCFAQGTLCRAKAFMAASLPQAKAVTIGQFIVPTQTTEVASNLASTALSMAASTVSSAGYYLDSMFNVSAFPYGCLAADATRNDSAGVPYATDLTALYVDGYRTYEELTELAVKTTVDASDAQFSSTNSLSQAVGRAVAGTSLSRTAAAHILTAGDSGLLGSSTKGFCSSGSLTPEGTAALSVFRESAISPVAILNDALTIDVLLDGVGSAVPNGSVRQRLAEMYQYPALLTGTPVEQYYGLTLPAFQQARSFMQEEIAAFSRSTTATLPAKTLPGGTKTTYPRFSATAGAPTPLPSAYYSAIARYTVSPGYAISNPPVDYGYDGLDRFIDASVSHAAQLVMAPLNNAITVPADALSPLALLVASKERIARFTFQNIGADPTSDSVTVDGFGPTDGIRFLVGEDQLRCAVQGSIEGAPCTDIGVAVTATNVAPIGFNSSVNLSPIIVPAGPKRVYVVRPKSGIAVATAAPGQFQALAGASVDTIRASVIVTPVVPAVEKRIADILEPNKNWCAHSKVSCAGTDFDERLPLENELSDNQDGVESSWKHYLQQAKDAAAEADMLGTDYVNTGLQKTQNALDEETRREQQLERAEDEIQKLQSLCGTSLDSREMLNLLTNSTSVPDLQKVSGAYCDAATPCAAGYFCTSIGFASAGGGSTKNMCLVDLAKLAAADNTGNPDLKRLADCISDQQLSPFVSLGTTPVCLWQSKANPNLICQGGLAGQQCPKATNQDCATALAPLPTANGGVTAVASTPMGFFDTANDAIASQLCINFRRLRKTPGAGDGSASGGYQLIDTLTSGFPFDTLKLKQTGNRLKFEMRYGGYAAIDLDGSTLYETGNAFTSGPNTKGTWPCLTPGGAMPTNMPPDCAGTGSGLLCQAFNCSDPVARTKANYMMMKAVMAAKSIGRGTDPFPLGQSVGSGTNYGPIPAWASFDTDAPTDVVSMFGLGNAVTRTFGTDGVKYVVSTTSSTDPAGIGWYKFAPTGTCGSYNTNCTVNDVCAEPGLGSVRCINQRDGSKTALESQRLFGKCSGCTGLVGFDLVNHQDGSDPWVVKRLVGSSKDDLRLSFSTGHGDGVTSPVFAISGVSDWLGDNGSNAVLGNGEDALNGYELLCAAQAGDLQPSVSLSSPPTVSSVADLSRVASYISVLAKQIKMQAGSRVFANVPTIAVSSLSHSGGQGAYPQFNGNMGDALAKLRGGMTRLQETIPVLSNEVAAFGYDIQALHDTLSINSNNAKIADLQLWSTISTQLSACAATAGIQSLISLSTVATCANSIAQIDIATEINKLQISNTQLLSALATQDFGTKFSSHATNMQTLSLRFTEAAEDVDGSLSTIEGLRAAAKVSLTRALELASYQSANSAVVTAVVGNLFDGKQIRYQRALKNAQRMAFLAKRAIEQRLGVRLSELTEPLPLVDAPSNWESKGCTTSGLDYSDVTLAKDPSLVTSGGAQRFADGFIGDYVSKLGNVVESYQLVNNFHEGTDTAVISLRDDIMGVRAPCDVASPNLLYYTSNLQAFGTPGWKQESCTMQTVNGQQVPAPNCVSVDNGGPIPLSVLPDPALANAPAFQLKFGAAASAATKMDQTVGLNAGLYRFSWYTPDVAGAAAGFVSSASGGVTQVAATGTAQAANTWGRRFITFSVTTDGVSPSRPVTLGFARLSATTVSFTVAGPMLEKLPNVSTDYALAPFVGTTGTLTAVLPACQDTDGSVFRTTGWQLNCERLCPDGYSSQCTNSAARSYCYHQASFSLNQRDIQLGKVLNFSGFARGNFNYRIDSVGLNFVGTGIIDCSASSSPAACSGGGFVPYTLSHVGPFYVRNYQGEDFQAHLFDGNIEHARGLGTERYITNPISSSDQSLLDQFMRGEFQGRPLDGNFVLKVWDGEGTKFDAIQDVQVVLKYRYWTRFK